MNPRNHCPLLPLSVLLCATNLQGAILLSDSFGDGDRTNQSLPVSAAWNFAQGSTGTVLDTNGTQQNLLLNAATSNNAQVWATFSSTTLNVGEVLTATFNFDVSGGASNNVTDGALRIGLFNVGTAVTADINSSIANTNWNAATGYSAFVDATAATTTSATSATHTLRQRTGTSTTLWAGAANSTTGIATTITGADQIVAGNTAALTADPLRYLASFSISRTDVSTVELLLSISDGSGVLTTLSATDSSAIDSTFNTFSVFTGPTIGQDFALDNVSISVVPEPSGSLMAAMGLIGGAMFRRRGEA